MTDEMDRCYDCGNKIPDGQITRVNEHLGNGVNVKVSLCQNCSAIRDKKSDEISRFLRIMAWVAFIVLVLILMLNGQFACVGIFSLFLLILIRYRCNN